MAVRSEPILTAFEHRHVSWRFFISDLCLAVAWSDASLKSSEILSALARIAKRLSQDVCETARDLPASGRAIDDLTDGAIPV